MNMKFDTREIWISDAKFSVDFPRNPNGDIVSFIYFADILNQSTGDYNIFSSHYIRRHWPSAIFCLLLSNSLSTVWDHVSSVCEKSLTAKTPTWNSFFRTNAGKQSNYLKHHLKLKRKVWEKWQEGTDWLLGVCKWKHIMYNVLSLILFLTIM